MKWEYPKYYSVFLVIILSTTTYSTSLDLTGLSLSKARHSMKPITQIISAEHTPVLPLISYHNSPFISVAASFATLAVPTFSKTEYGYPSFWFALSISPNLVLGANVSGFYWRDDNILTIGPFISTAWGNAEKSVSTTLHFHHLKGPDDFHLTDVAFDASRTIQKSVWTMGYGLTAHYFKIVLNVTDHDDPDLNYSQTVEMNDIFLRFGLFRHIGQYFQMGSELFLNADNMIVNLNAVYQF